jgi:hypothetical protein
MVETTTKIQIYSLNGKEVKGVGNENKKLIVESVWPWKQQKLLLKMEGCVIEVARKDLETAIQSVTL